MIQTQHPKLSVRRQCELVGINRNRLAMSYYNHQRKHEHLGYYTPWSLYEAATALPEVA